MQDLQTIYNNLFFLRPQLLWAFVPVVWLALLMFRREKQQEGWKKNIADHLQPFMIMPGKYSTKFPKVLLLVVLSLLILAVSGPTWKKIDKPGATIESALVVVFDASRSMLSNDIKPNRLERGKQKVHDLLQAQPGTHVSLIAFAQTAHMVLPFTNDYKTFDYQLESVSPKIMPVQGSNLKAALLKANQLLERIEAPSTILVITDGIEKQEVAMVKSMIDSTQNYIEFMALGTPQGAPIPLGGGRVYKDKNKQTVIPKLNPSNLLELNQIDRVNVTTITLDDSDVEKLATNLRANLSFQKDEEPNVNDWEEYGYYLCFPLAFLCLLWFRKGWKVQWAIILPLLFSSCSSLPEESQETIANWREVSWIDLWFTPDQQGQRMEDLGLIDSALVLYENPMKRGYLLYNQEKFEEANVQFLQIPTDEGRFNSGMCFAEMKNWTSARDAFQQALDINPDNHDAKQNLQYILAIIEERKKMYQPPNEEDKHIGKSEEKKELSELGDLDFDEKKEDGGKKKQPPSNDQDANSEDKEKEFQPIDPDAPFSGEKAKNIVLSQMDNNPATFMKKKFQYQLYRDSVAVEPTDNKW